LKGAKPSTAVNFWAEFFGERAGGETLKDFAPFTSKDCDIWAGYPLVQYLREQKGKGRLIIGSSPADGQVAIFKMPGSPERVVDILSNVFGIPAHQLDRTRERSLTVSRVRVLDPLFLFQSKCHCLIGLDQAERQDEKHLRILMVILPEYLRELLAEAQARRITQRAFINELKLLRQILRDRIVRRALESLRVDPEGLIPWSDLEGCGLSKVERFIASLR